MPTLLLFLAVLAFQGAAAFIPYDEARSILATHDKVVPESGWPAWVARHDADIRGRLARGDEDSLVYLWLYGTSFTGLPRATEQEIAALGASPRAEALLLRRLDDLVAGVASPGANERLQFARRLLARKGINPATPAGKKEAKVFLVDARARVIAENDRFGRAADAAKRSGDPDAALTAYATLFRERGLSSDTRLTAAFAIDKAVAALAAAGKLEQGTVRRAAIVGPGLDFTDKAEGYDFYPQQTIQPFALVDSLARMGLAKSADLRVSTFDLSPRVNEHLDAARRRARAGAAYALQLPLASNDPRHEWQPEFVAYWQAFGGRIGRGVPAIPAPAGMPGVRVRAVRIDPAVVLSIVPYDLNIIVQRLAPLPDDERFDLIVATNILVYYDTFDQALALANIAQMLRPGGFFLTNYAVSPTSPMHASAGLMTPVFFDRQNNGDTIFCYQRR